MRLTESQVSFFHDNGYLLLGRCALMTAIWVR